jgi:WD40 repeat protein
MPRHPPLRPLAPTTALFLCLLATPTTAQQAAVVIKVETPVEALAFSPDGKTLAAARGDNTVALWDLATRKPRAVLRHERRPLALAFSPDGKTLAAGGGDSFAKLWDVATGTEKRALEHDLVDVGALAWLPDGKTLAVGAGKHVQLWDAPAGKKTRLLAKHRAPVSGVAVSPDGATLATLAFAEKASELRLWDLKTGRAKPPLQGLDDFDEIVHLAMSPDGKRLAVLGHKFDKKQTEGVPVIEGAIVRLWNPAAPRPILSIKVLPNSGGSLAFSPNGKFLALPSADDAVLVCDAATGREVLSLKGHDRQVLAAAFSPDGRTLASAGHDDTIRLWDLSKLP